ncbi:hypothetical protein ABEB36_004051 [Hypothenemus hampei]|uniref:Gamma-aminobutyric acid type B receptor subunit 2 n=1 Tax=Hypothenemus hampei TaxID=57062 RepID=A0ABD1F240_HYPHA
MFQNHPFQQTFCILFISLTLIFFFVQYKTKYPEFSFASNETTSSFSFEELLVEYSANSTEATISREIIFDVVEVLNSVTDLQNDINKTLFQQDNTVQQRNIYILGLFELTNKLGNQQEEGASELIAAKLAVRHVNALKILPGYKLILLINDTQGDPGVAIDRLFHAIYSENTVLVVLGSRFSNVTEALAHIVPYWNILQVSYGARSPALSDRRQFPLFFRTVAPDSSHNIVKVDFIRHHKWPVVVVFSHSENQYLLPINHLITQLEMKNITCISTVTFTTDNYKEQLNVLKELDVRIILGSFSASMAPLIFCQAHSLGMTGSEYVWIIENHQINWWKEAIGNCFQSNLTQATESVFLIGDYEYNNRILQSSELVKKIFENLSKISNRAKNTYDAIWTIALTLRASNAKDLDNLQYTNMEKAYHFVKLMENMQFIGLSGLVKFKQSDRVGDYIVSQIQDKYKILILKYSNTK